MPMATAIAIALPVTIALPTARAAAPQQVAARVILHASAETEMCNRNDGHFHNHNIGKGRVADSVIAIMIEV